MSDDYFLIPNQSSVHLTSIKLPSSGTRSLVRPQFLTIVSNFSWVSRNISPDLSNKDICEELVQLESPFLSYRTSDDKWAAYVELGQCYHNQKRKISFIGVY